MPSLNTIIIASAGSGKTTRIVREALSKPQRKIAIVTYTLNNLEELRRKFYKTNGSIPPNIEIFSWFTFLLRHGARPYQGIAYDDHRIQSITWISGRSARYVKKENVKRYYFSGGKHIYSDKISEFVCLCNSRSGELVIERLSKIYDEIYIDEVQDLAGYDLNFIELLLNSSINVFLVGDNRQWIYSTNHSAKNSRYKGTKIVDCFKVWEKRGLCEIHYLSQSYRCNQAICDFADNLYPDMPKTVSRNSEETGHDGVFLVPNNEVSDYVSQYSPTILRYDRRTDCGRYHGINFGESKGRTFDRVLIFPHGPIRKYLATGQRKHIEKSCSKFYVAVTRARYSVAFVHSGECKVEHVFRFQLMEEK